MDTHGFQVTLYIGHMSAKRSSATSFIQTVNLMKKFIRFPLRLQKAFDNIDSMSLIFCNHDAEKCLKRVHHYSILAYRRPY